MKKLKLYLTSMEPRDFKSLEFARPRLDFDLS